MAHYERVESEPVTYVDEGGQIVLAAAVLGRMSQFGKTFLHVASWEAGQGQSTNYLSPADFASWRRSFAKREQEA